MYNIKIATEEDTQDLLKMCFEFFSFSEYSKLKSLDKDTVLGTINWYLTQPKNHAIIFLLTHQDKAVGMLSMISVPSPFWDTFVASEQVWWVDPSHRGKHSLNLFYAAEEWAKRVGCSGVSFSCLEENSLIEKIYIKNGYKLTEKNYFKEL